MKRVLLATAVCAALTGCLGEGANAPAGQKVASSNTTDSPPVSDIASPDKALKSYWAVVDWGNRMDAERHNKELQSKTWQLRVDSISGVAAPSFADRATYTADSYERDITEAKVETDTRAVIHAVIKNATPIPEGAEVTKYDRERREQGDRFRYVMERGQDGWKVAEIWQFDQFYDKKWSKIKPYLAKPSVGTLTIRAN